MEQLAEPGTTLLTPPTLALAGDSRAKRSTFSASAAPSAHTSILETADTLESTREKGS